jgi:hypothetical protein
MSNDPDCIPAVLIDWFYVWAFALVLGVMAGILLSR